MNGRWITTSSMVVASAASSYAVVEKPNVVLIFLDDAGWGDFNTFSATEYPTPHIDRLANEGTVFQQFYVPVAICSASRAAIMTGCYPERVGLMGALPPGGRGLDPRYATLAEVLKENGYSTSWYGKWHLGDHPETRPQSRGFDETFGIMYSNDMWKYHPVHPDRWPPLKLWKNGQVKIPDVEKEHQELFTVWFTEQAVCFINRHREVPFFLYLAHPMPHVPLFVSEKFSGASGHGLYADVIMEIDWSVGEIMKALEKNGLKENTLVIFSSDNGPWLTYGTHAGRTPYREGKHTAFDGGVRSPTIMTFPGRIPAGIRSSSVLSTIDLLPTICAVTGTPLPENEIDGKNVWDLIVSKQGADHPHEYYAFSDKAVIRTDGRWKLVLPHRYSALARGGTDGMPGSYQGRQIEMALFDMQQDPYETENVIEQYPEIAQALQRYAKKHRQRFE